ncbi:hypothetical protein diail_11731 [Diaporthe ilicicola]|nr:hypothetical protein diail_11731 [Diaporthe ilicicola]
MAPTIPRAPLRALSSSILPCATSIPSTTSTAFRTFTTTASRLEVEIPPESPRFINLPDLPQSSEHKLPPVKGVLPVPRQIFHRRNNGSHKIQAGFVDETAPRSKAEAAGEAARSDKAAWKRALAESRRQALAAGIERLWERKNTREGREKRRAEAHRRRNLAAADAPEGLDDVFTRGTVTQATLDTRVVRDPLYKERQLESQAKTAALAGERSEARKNAIQRLYVEAGNFIVNEDELAKKVDDVFAEDYFKKKAQWKGKYDSQNIWDASGLPTPVKSMFASLKGTSNQVLKSYRTEVSSTARRQQIVSGELTGAAVSEGSKRRVDV